MRTLLALASLMSSDRCRNSTSASVIVSAVTSSLREVEKTVFVRGRRRRTEKGRAATVRCAGGVAATSSSAAGAPSGRKRRHVWRPHLPPPVHPSEEEDGAVCSGCVVSAWADAHVRARGQARQFGDTGETECDQRRGRAEWPMLWKSRTKVQCERDRNANSHVPHKEVGCGLRSFRRGSDAPTNVTAAASVHQWHELAAQALAPGGHGDLSQRHQRPP